MRDGLAADAFKRDGWGFFDGLVVRDHADGVPRAVLGAKRAPDTALKVHLDDLL